MTVQRPVLIGGFMASGKTTVGPLVASALGRPWADLDALVEDQMAEEIGLAFDRGEDWFRRAESLALVEAVENPAIVVSLGGGTLHSPLCRDAVARCRVVVIDTPRATVMARIERDGARPLAGRADALWEARAEGYRRFPRVDGRGTPDEVAARILEEL